MKHPLNSGEAKEAKSEAKEAKGEAKDEAILLSDAARSVYNEMLANPAITRDLMMVKLGLSASAIYRAIHELKQKGIITRVGGRKIGYWEILKPIAFDE